MQQPYVVDSLAVMTSVALAVGIGLGLACSPTQRSQCKDEVASTAPPNTDALGHDGLRFSPATLAFVDGGRTVVLGNRVETRFVDVATGNVLHRGLPATVLAPSPDGSLLLAADGSNGATLDADEMPVSQLSLRDPRTGIEIHSVAVPYMFSSSIRWVDANTVALGDALVPVAALWQDRLAATWPSANDSLAGYRLPQEPSLASKCSYNPAYPDTCRPTRRAVPCGLARSPSQKQLVVRLCMGSRSLLRFDDVGVPAQPLTLQAGTWYAFAFLDEQRLVATRTDGPVVIYNLQSNVIEATLPSRAHTALTVASDGHTLATWSGSTGIQLWDVTAGRAPRELLPQPGHRSTIAALAFSPDGTTLASGGVDGTVRQWDVASMAQRKVIDVASPITGLALANDGRVAFNAYLTVELWNLATTTRIAHTGPQGGSNTNVHIAFAADGETIEYQDRDGLGTVRWSPTTDVTSNGPADTLPPWRSQQSAWESVDHNHRVALRSQSGVEVRNASDGRLIESVRISDIAAMALSNDGSLLAVGTLGGGLFWLDLAAPDAGLQPLALPTSAAGPASGVTAIAIAPDNRSIACGDAVGHLQLVRR